MPFKKLQGFYSQITAKVLSQLTVKIQGKALSLSLSLIFTIVFQSASSKQPFKRAQLNLFVELKAGQQFMLVDSIFKPMLAAGGLRDH